MENRHGNEMTEAGQPQTGARTERQQTVISRRQALSAFGIAGAALLTAGAGANALWAQGGSANEAVYGPPQDLDGSCCRMTTLAELRSMASPVADAWCYVTDRGCEGAFYYDPSDTVSPDNTGLTVVSVSGARWKRIHQGEISIAWFGAVGNGVTDCTEAIQAALDTGLPVWMPAGTYIVTDTLRVKANGQMIQGAGRFATIVRNTSNASPLLHFGDNTDPTATGYALSCAARDFTLEGNALTTEGVAFLGPQEDVSTWGSASRACLLEGVRVSGIGSGPALRVSAWTPTVTGCEFWNSKQGIRIGLQVYSGRFIANYISGHAQEAIYCDVPASKASALLFTGNVVQWSGSSTGMIVLYGGGAWTFQNTYVEVANPGCNAVWALFNPCTNVTIDGVHFSSGTGESAIDVVSTEIRLCTVRNVQVFGNVRRGVHIKGTLPITTIDSIRQPSGSSSVGLIDDQSERKQTFVNNAPTGMEAGAATFKSLASVNGITTVNTATGQTQWFVRDGHAYFGGDLSAVHIGSAAGGTALAVRAGANEAYLQAAGVLLGPDQIGIRYGSGSPEGVLEAPAGSLYVRADGAPGATLYVKESGSGSTGWSAK